MGGIQFDMSKLNVPVTPQTLVNVCDSQEIFNIIMKEKKFQTLGTFQYRNIHFKISCWVL
jgi:hypothetical protein